tara:strand:+ start:354 stop:512 length:159 start_codon:yes stop_codon:yes gene_type:complete
MNDLFLPDFCHKCEGKGYVEIEEDDKVCYECEGGYIIEPKGNNDDEIHFNTN